MVKYIVEMGKPYDIGKALHYFNVPFVEIRRVESPWHTGTPTENGWYLIVCGIGNSDEVYFAVDYWSNEIKDWRVARVKAWQKIEPYKEAST